MPRAVVVDKPEAKPRGFQPRGSKYDPIVNEIINVFESGTGKAVQIELEPNEKSHLVLAMLSRAKDRLKAKYGKLTGRQQSVGEGVYKVWLEVPEAKPVQATVQTPAPAETEAVLA